MSEKNETPPLEVGTWVKIRDTTLRDPCRIVEYRGPLGPGGARIYRVRFKPKPYPAYAEVREDQLVVLPDQANGMENN